MGEGEGLVVDDEGIKVFVAEEIGETSMAVLQLTNKKTSANTIPSLNPLDSRLSSPDSRLTALDSIPHSPAE